jgi:adenylate cyclase
MGLRSSTSLSGLRTDAIRTNPEELMDVTANARAQRELIIVFVDLSVFTKDASSREETAIAEIIDAYYERVAAGVSAAGGAVVKFIGDGALLVFPHERADDALAALFALRREIDGWLAKEGWSSRLTVRAHSGSVIAGGFGARDAKQFDVIGNCVNVAARLPRPYHITPQVFRLLSPDARKRWKKHTPPITYIPAEDRHP